MDLFMRQLKTAEKQRKVIEMTEKIAEVLENNLCRVYCNTCAYDLTKDLCGDCHRKYMNWRISHDAAVWIAREIERIWEDDLK